MKRDVVQYMHVFSVFKRNRSSRREGELDRNDITFCLYNGELVFRMEIVTGQQLQESSDNLKKPNRNLVSNLGDDNPGLNGLLPTEL